MSLPQIFYPLFQYIPSSPFEQPASEVHMHSNLRTHLFPDSYGQVYHMEFCVQGNFPSPLCHCLPGSSLSRVIVQLSSIFNVYQLLNILIHVPFLDLSLCCQLILRNLSRKRTHEKVVDDMGLEATFNTDYVSYGPVWSWICYLHFTTDCYRDCPVLVSLIKVSSWQLCLHGHFVSSHQAICL